MDLNDLKKRFGKLPSVRYLLNLHQAIHLREKEGSPEKKQFLASQEIPDDERYVIGKVQNQMESLLKQDEIPADERDFLIKECLFSLGEAWLLDVLLSERCVAGVPHWLFAAILLISLLSGGIVADLNDFPYVVLAFYLMWSLCANYYNKKLRPKIRQERKEWILSEGVDITKSPMSIF